jgi:DNA-binding transcriptional MerR regulator
VGRVNDRRDLLPIGRFARVTGLTHRALRHYDELGLLAPALVDEDSGYRLYAPEQVRTAETIVALRELELPLEEIRAVLERDDDAHRRARLVAHRRTLAERLAATQQILDRLDELIEGRRPLVPEPEDVLYEIEIEELPEQPVLSIRDRVRQEELKRFIPEAFAELYAHLREAGGEEEGIAFSICPFADDEGVVEIEVAVPLAAPVPGAGRVESRSVPACTAVVLTHNGPYDQLTRSYRALSHWLELQGVASAGDPREYYVTDREETLDPDDYVTRVAWPVALVEGWKPSEEIFELPLPAPPA